MAAPAFITADGVAGLLGLDNGAAFLRRRKDMQQDSLFPPPMPHCARPLLWKADEVAAWIARQGNAPLPGEALTPAMMQAMQGGKLHLLRLARTA